MEEKKEEGRREEGREEGRGREGGGEEKKEITSKSGSDIEGRMEEREMH